MIVQGYETLTQIESSMTQLRNEMAQMDTHIDTLVKKIQSLQEEKASVLRQFAQVQWDAIASGDIDAAEFTTQIYDELMQRKTAYAKLQKDIQQLQVDIQALEAKRRDASMQLQTISQKVVAKQSDLQKELSQDTHYQALLQDVSRAKQKIEAARKKAEDAETFYTQKAKPYEEDPLFAYLWKRHYGTTAYNANFLTSFFDGKIAQWIDYHDYVADYRRICEIPQYLKQNIDMQQKTYDKKLASLQDYERTKAQESGLLELQENENKQRKTIDDLDDQIEDAEDKLRKLTAKKESYAQNQDEASRRIVTLMSRHLKDSDLITLMQQATKTHSDQDDTLVRKLNDLQRQYDKTQNTLNEARKHYDEIRSRLTEFESLRSRFKRSRYDDIRSGFDNNAGQIGEVLGGLLGGLLQSNAAWDTLRRSYRPMHTGSLPNFGSGGLDPQGSPWSFPMPRDGSDSFGFPDIGGDFTSQNPIDSDTFRTGGGF